MAIWRYADTVQEKTVIQSAMGFSDCTFCSSKLELLRNDRQNLGGHGEYVTDTDQFWVCSVCGWWKGHRSYRHTDFGFRISVESGAAASLRELDLSDLSLRMDE